MFVAQHSLFLCFQVSSLKSILRSRPQKQLDANLLVFLYLICKTIRKGIIKITKTCFLTHFEYSYLNDASTVVSGFAKYHFWLTNQCSTSLYFNMEDIPETSNPEIFTQFVLDPTSFNLSKRVNIGDPMAIELFRISRDMCNYLHTQRMKQLEELN